MRSRASLSTILFVFLIAAGMSGCKRSSINDNLTMSLQVASPSFRQGEAIPKTFTCDGPNLSPALSWSTPPANTQSFALIANDQDSRFSPFVHWVLFNVPSESHSLLEGVATQEQLADGSGQGKNNNGSIGYWGPCPPGSSPHHYLFTLYALDSRLDLPPKADEKQLAAAMKGHILVAGQLMGHYHR